MGFIPASFLVYLVHEKSSNGKCGIQEHHFETGNEAMKVPFPQDFFGMTSWLLWCLDVVWTQRHVGEMKHWQGINSCWLVGGAYGFVKKVQIMQNFIQHASGKQWTSNDAAFPFFSVVELRHSLQRKLHETPKVSDSFWLHWDIPTSWPFSPREDETQLDSHSCQQKPS